MFLSFHNFRPDDGRRILSDAVASGQGIAIFELTSPRLPQVHLYFSLFLDFYSILKSAPDYCLCNCAAIHICPDGNYEPKADFFAAVFYLCCSDRAADWSD